MSSLPGRQPRNAALADQRSITDDEQPRTAQQRGGRLCADSRPGWRSRSGAAASAAAGRGEREAMGTARPGDPAAGQSCPGQALSAGGRD
jgi:hypothetical protein